MKVSVHASGQIHMRPEGRDIQHLAPALAIGGGRWAHALELRFLLSPDSYFPPPQKLKAKQRAFLVDVPDDHVLIVNLLTGNLGCSLDEPLPSELLPAARPLWRALLSDGRPVLLTGRVLQLDQLNRDQIAYVRAELNPRVNFSEPLTNLPYVEVQRIVWSPAGGNVILVVPMGKEAVREPAGVDSAAESTGIAELRCLAVSSPSTSLPIVAPNGAVVASVSLAGAETVARLRKNESGQCSLGVLTLKIDPDALIFGQSFRTARFRLLCPPDVAGVQPKDWQYRVYSAFDGETFTVEVRPMSCALRASGNGPPSNLDETEEIVLAAPINGLTLKATAAAPEASASFDMSLLLRDR
jgi:hypothetical protein